MQNCELIKKSCDFAKYIVKVHIAQIKAAILNGNIAILQELRIKNKNTEKASGLGEASSSQAELAAEAEKDCSSLNDH